MPIPSDIRQLIENPRAMSSQTDREQHYDRIIGSMTQAMGDDSELGGTQTPSWADLFYVQSVLEPIIKGASPSGNDRAARDTTPWHLIPQVLNALARMEDTRSQVDQEATRALKLNSSLRKGKGKTAGGEDQALLLPDDKKKKLQSLANPTTSKTLRQRYMFVSLQARRIHIYEDLRIRAAGIDELIKSYFPRDITAPTPHLFISSTKTASPEELKAYTNTRTLTYDLYRAVDKWEDDLRKMGISEDTMNGLSQDSNPQFSYPEDFERNFPPSPEWIQVVNIATGWAGTIQNMATTLEETFETQ